MASSEETQGSTEADYSDPSKKTKKDRLNLESFIGKSKIGSWAALVDTLGDDLGQIESPIEASLNRQTLSSSSFRANPPSLDLPPSKFDSNGTHGGHNQSRGKGNDQYPGSPKYLGKKGSPGAQGTRSFNLDSESLLYVTVSQLPQTIRVSEVVMWLLGIGIKTPKEDINIWPSSRDSSFDCFIILRDARSHQTILQNPRIDLLSPSAIIETSYHKPSEFQDKSCPVSQQKTINTNTRLRDRPHPRETPSQREPHYHSQDYSSNHTRQGKGRSSPFGDDQASFHGSHSPHTAWQSSAESPGTRSEPSTRPKLNLLPRSVGAPLGGLSDAYSNKPTPFAGAKPVLIQSDETLPNPDQPEKQPSGHITVLSPRARNANANANANSRKGGSSRAENLEVFIRITPTPSPSASPALEPVAGTESA